MKPPMTRPHRRDALCLLAAAALAGCATRATPPRRLYALTGTPPLPEHSPGKDNRAWVLSPQIALPELLDRDELLVAEGSAGLAPLPEARWAEPLREALPRLLAEDLLRLRQPYPVTLGRPAQEAESLRLVVQVDEWLARREGPGLQLTLRARWHWGPLQAPAGTALPPAGSAELTLPCSAQPDALADAYRRSVTLLAARIVASS